MEIEWADEASANLKSIFDYIAENNPVAASDTIDGIYAKVQLLENQPNIGFVYKTQASKEIRIILYGHYKIAYTYILEQSIISVLGVYHGAMDIQKYL
ncbi:MAG: type II toxin-antitoxin system RelE/ParE family toxin [Leptospirales bacterium]